jgi:beta-glucosidase-like glycosyl hydrolase
VSCPAENDTSVPATCFPTASGLVSSIAAAETLVLLKNAGGLLPLDFKQTKTIAVIGTFAKTPSAIKDPESWRTF